MTSPLQRTLNDIVESQRAWTASLVGDSRLSLERIYEQAAMIGGAGAASLIANSRLTVGGIPPELLNGRWADLDTYASVSLQPLTRAATGLSESRIRDLTSQIAEISTARLFEDPRVGDLADALDQEGAVEQLVESDELRSAVESIVESEPVSELLGNVEQDALDGKAGEAFEHATSVVAAVEGLTTGQIVTIFTSLDILVIASVMQIYGYDLGGLPGVVDLALSPLAVYAFCHVIRKRGPK